MGKSARGAPRFVGLHWKGFLWMSTLLLALSTAFYGLSHHELMRQFHADRETEIQSFRRQITGLFRGTSDRLIRLGGAILAMGDLGEALRSPSPDKLAAVTAGAHYASLGYELDVQRLAFFTIDGQQRWQWTQTETPAVPEMRLREAIAQVRREERPVTLLACQPHCLLHAFVPILAEGENVGVMELGQSIAGLVIEFRHLTGADIGLVVPASVNGGTALPRWGSVVPALTEAAKLTAILEELSARYPDPTALDSGQPIQWGAASYEVHRFAVPEFMPAEAGFILFISDVSARLNEIKTAVRRGLLATISAMGAAELLLLYLVRVPVRRLRWLAQVLPLLAEGSHDLARKHLAADQKPTAYRDEIDVLYDTAMTLSHQLEEAGQALAAKNQELAEERDLVQGILDAAQVLVVTQTRHGIIQMANEYAAQITGFAALQLRGKHFLELVADVDGHREVLGKLEALYATGQRRSEHEHNLGRRDGTQRQVMWVHTRLHSERLEDATVVSVGLDITERVQAESQLRWLANNDTLTGLVNRYRFMEELTRTFDEVSRAGMTAALLLFDLDHFKEINDTSGHAAGDALLRTIADELRARARKSDIVARLGGDEFAVLMPNTDSYGAEIFARQLNERLGDAPFIYGDRRYRVGASIGIALLPEHGANIHELMANADLAMYEAKRAGRACAQVFAYEQGHGEALARGVYWKDTLTRALTEGQLFFHFQPVTDAKTGAIAYHEALLRLTLEDGQVAMPHEFLAPAQRAGLMQELDGFVVRAALEALLAYPSKCLAVNLSAAALSDAHWAEPLTEAVHMQRFDPERLIFEITETAAIADMAKARHIMDTLRRQGFRFALDDFGAGFSSLYYLKHLPVAYVKIDRSLIKDLATDEGNRNFVRAITTMVHAYGKKVVGEGVENAETLTMLREMGVALVQGFYISHPSEKDDQTFWGPDRAGLM